MHRFFSVLVPLLIVQATYQEEIKSFLTVHKEDGRTEVPVMVTVNYDEETIAAKPVMAPYNDEVTYNNYKKKFKLRRFQMDASLTCFLEHVEEMSFHSDLDLLRKVKRSLIRNSPETLIISNASITSDDLKSLGSTVLTDLCRDLQVYRLAPTTANIKHNTRSKRAAHGRGRQPLKQRFHGQVEAQVSPANDGSPGPEAFAIASPNAAVTKVGGSSGYAHAKSHVTVESDYGHGKSIRTMSSTSTFSSSRGSTGGGASSQHQGGYVAAPQRGTYSGAGPYHTKGQIRPASQNGYHRGTQTASSAASSVHSGLPVGTASGPVHGQAGPSQYPATYEGRQPSGQPAQDSSVAHSSGGTYKTYQWTVKHPNGYNAAHWYTGPVGSDGRPALVEGPVETAPLQVHLPGTSSGRTVISTSASGGGDLQAIGVGISQSGSIAERAHADAQSILSATESNHSQGHHTAPAQYPVRQASEQQQVQLAQQSPYAPSHPQQYHNAQHTAYAGAYPQEAPAPSYQAPQAVHQQHQVSPHPQEPISQPAGSLHHGYVSTASAVQQEVRPAHKPHHTANQPQQAHAHYASSGGSYSREVQSIPSGKVYQQQTVRQTQTPVPDLQQIPGSFAHTQQVVPVQPQTGYIRQTVQEPVPNGGHPTQLQTFRQDVSQTSAMEAMAQHVFTQTERIPVHQPQVYPVHIPQPQPSLPQEAMHKPKYHEGVESPQQAGALLHSATSTTHTGQVQQVPQLQQTLPQVLPSRPDHGYSAHSTAVQHQVDTGAGTKPLPVPQPGQVVHDVRGQHVFQVVSGRVETVEDSALVLQPGQSIPELPGSSVPQGFRGRVIQTGVAAGHGSYHQPVTPNQHFSEGQANYQQQHIHQAHPQQQVYVPHQHGSLPQHSLQQQPYEGQSVHQHAQHPQYVQQKPHPLQEQPTAEQTLQQPHHPQGPVIQHGHTQHQSYHQQSQQHVTQGQTAPQPAQPQQQVQGQPTQPRQQLQHQPVQPQQQGQVQPVQPRQQVQHQPVQPQLHVQPHLQPIQQPYSHQLHAQRQQPHGVQPGFQQVHTQRQGPAQHQPVQQQQVHSQQTYTQHQVYPQQVAQPQFTTHSETAAQSEYIPTPQEMVDAVPAAQGGTSTTGRLPHEQPKLQQVPRPTGTAVRPHGHGRTPVRIPTPQQSSDTQDCTPAYYTCKIVYGPVKSDQVCLPPPPCCVPC